MRMFIQFVMLVSVSGASFAIPPFKAQERCPRQYNNCPRTIVMHVGETFTINLKGHASSGYTWYMTEPAIEDCIKLLRKATVPLRQPGGQTSTLFTFLACAPGEEILSFEYSRPWSWQAEETQTYRVIIRPSHAYTHAYLNRHTKH